MGLYVTQIFHCVTIQCSVLRQQHSDDEVVFASVASGLKGLDAVLGSEIKHFALPDTGISLHQDLETAKVGPSRLATVV